MAVDKVEAYLAALTDAQRVTLEAVRAAIRQAAPGAVEAIHYGVPAFVLGKPIAGYGASANHCAYYPMSGSIIAAMKSDLDGYVTSKGAVQFPIGAPPQPALIRKLVEARIAEITPPGETVRPPER